MPMLLTCHCGKTLRARDDQAGRTCRCPACGSVLRVPYPVAKVAPPPEEPEIVEEPDPPPAPLTPLEQLKSAVKHRHAEQAAAVNPPAPATHVKVASVPQRGWRTIETGSSEPPSETHVPPPESVARIERSWRGKLFWLLLLFGIPLLYLTVIGEPDIKQQLKKTLDANPQLRGKFTFDDEEHLTVEAVEQFLDVLPNHKIVGALIARDSWAHWGMAALATLIFFGIVAAAVPGEDVTAGELLLSGLFTATMGVSLLLLFQYFHVCFCLISIWYVAAEDPSAPFGASLLGFVLGVGVAEEITKCLPVLFRIHKFETGWREACLIGMASGAGFGISEGVHYCVNQYNGLEPGSVYLMRFGSDVALHVMLSGAAGIMIWRKQKFLGEWRDPYDWVLNMTAIMIGPILLHGLFDTLAKKEMHFGAMGVWVASFAFLAWQIGLTRQREIDASIPKSGGPKLVRTEKGTRFVGDMNS